MVDQTPEAVLGMSDEDFLQLNGPESVGGGSSPTDEEIINTTTEGGAGASEEGGEAAPTTGADGGTEGNDQSQPKTGEDGEDGKSGASAESEAGKEGEAGTSEGNAAADAGAAPGEAAAGDDKTKVVPPTGSGEADPAVKLPTAEEAQGFYQKIMAPFKANGKTIELKTPEEAIQLMQMGANYTRKMQDLQPHRKALTMLQNNGLLDEDKLSYLIDLDKKNPEAIKKLIKDSGLDPLEIDTAIEPAYQPGQHQVTDQEVAFRTALEDLSSSDSGKQTIQLIDTTWDANSKEAIWQQPEIISAIQQQRELGIYDLITTEIDRQRTLGMIRPETPFLQAYKTVGDQLAAATTQAQGTQAQAKPEPKVIATTTAAPAKQVENDDKAGAASPTRTTPSSKSKELINPLAMSDDEFLKKFDGRL